MLIVYFRFEGYRFVRDSVCEESPDVKGPELVEEPHPRTARLQIIYPLPHPETHRAR